jgi:cbb3-type cytochrome oxidase subunit 3
MAETATRAEIIGILGVLAFFVVLVAIPVLILHRDERRKQADEDERR